MTMIGTRAQEEIGAVPGATGPAPARALWMDPDPVPDASGEPPEQAFAEIFGDADRVRIALWIDRAAPAHGGLFGADSCAAELGLHEAGVRSALAPLLHVGMIGYRSGLYMRHEHPLWAVLKVLRGFAGPALAPEPTGPAPHDPPSSQDARAATFSFG